MISNRPTRPLPSRNGWMVSNWTCASPARTTTGSPSPSSWRKRSSCAHAVGHRGVRRRHEDRVARAAAADPVLRAPELPRILAAAAPAREQHVVDLADQAVGERKALAQPSQPVLERGDVVRDLDHVVERHPGRLVELEEEQVGQRRLRALDLRREHRLLADVGIEEERLVRQERRDAVEPPERQRRALERPLERPVQDERRIGGSGAGTKARTRSPPTVVTS